MAEHGLELTGEMAGGDSTLARVRAIQSELPSALQRVAELVLADPASAARATIVELAERSSTSPATVTRFCRALGFEGYAELRLGIAAEPPATDESAAWAVSGGKMRFDDRRPS